MRRLCPLTLYSLLALLTAVAFLGGGCSLGGGSASTTASVAPSTVPPTSGTTATSAPTSTAPPTSIEQTTSTTRGATTTTAASTTTTSAKPGGTTTTTAGSVAGSVSLSTPAGAIKLTARQLAGQRLIYRYTGPTPPENLLSLIRKGEVAGVIFFGDNIPSRAQLAKAIATLEKANDDPGNPVRAPLLLMTDQEGGLVKRLSGEPLLSEKYIGLSADPVAAATKAGAGAAANLAAVGMNLNLTPVLDVYRTAGDFDDQYRRSYSTDPKVCGQLGAAFIGAQQKGGVAATAKHFPGLGAATATQNTDNRAVTLNIPAATLRSVDELPYKAAIAAGVKLVMLSWAIYPSLDPTLPAGLSPKIVQGELRERLGFKGVTISDSFGATAALPFGSTRHRALLAAQAGLDLLLCGSRQIAQDAFGGLYDRYSDGTLPAAGFKAAGQRVVSLRYSLK